jgi:peptide chain release factor 3
VAADIFDWKSTIDREPTIIGCSFETKLSPDLLVRLVRGYAEISAIDKDERQKYKIAIMHVLNLSRLRVRSCSVLPESEDTFLHVLVRMERPDFEIIDRVIMADSDMLRLRNAQDQLVIDVIHEIESVLQIQCAPITWPIGTGKRFKGIYHLYEDKAILYETGKGDKKQEVTIIEGLNNPQLDQVLENQAEELREEIMLIQGASHRFDMQAYLDGQLTPVFFGSALNNFGVQELLNDFVKYAPAPKFRETNIRQVEPLEPKFTGFVFKIQANMDPAHRDRIAFMRICSGSYKQGMKLRHVRLKRDIAVHDALIFMAGKRERAEEAFAGDIIGLHNHGTIQ